MKAARDLVPTPFVPVVLTLQSQAEVDAFFTVTNHCGLAKLLGLDAHDSFEVLLPYRNERAADRLHEALNAALKSNR